MRTPLLASLPEIGHLCFRQRFPASKAHTSLLGLLNSVHLTFSVDLRLKLCSCTSMLKSRCPVASPVSMFWPSTWRLTPLALQTLSNLAQMQRGAGQQHHARVEGMHDIVDGAISGNLPTLNARQRRHLAVDRGRSRSGLLQGQPLNQELYLGCDTVLTTVCAWLARQCRQSTLAVAGPTHRWSVRSAQPLGFVRWRRALSLRPETAGGCGSGLAPAYVLSRSVHSMPEDRPVTAYRTHFSKPLDIDTILAELIDHSWSGIQSHT